MSEAGTAAPSDSSEDLGEHRKDPTPTIELLDRIRQGDQEAMAQLYVRYRNYLLGHLISQLVRLRALHLDAEGILHDAFAKAWESIRLFEYAGERSFRNWMMEVILNKARDILRRERDGRVSSSETDERRSAFLRESVAREPSPSQAVRKQERAERVFAAISKLPPIEREVVIMKDWEGLTYDRIAEVLETPATTVRRHYGNAQNRIFRMLRGPDPEGPAVE